MLVRIVGTAAFDIRHEAVVIRKVKAEISPHGAEIIPAGDPFAPFTGLLQSGQKHSGKNSYYSNNDKKFNQRER
jgi:hypothetical protein